MLWIVTGVTLGFLGLVLYLPWLAHLFRFGVLPLPELLAALALGLVGLAWFEAIKFGRRLYRQGSPRSARVAFRLRRAIAAPAPHRPG
ncbi:hypothetical protein [Rhodoferax sp.]|uniref:hypothetical protein n=1 Tax=Rhodoferax sp. TaxID=50421 RepID=UPI0039B93D68